MIRIAFGLLLSAALVQGATNTAASASRADVVTAYNLCVDGDTLAIPAGTATWTSGVIIEKKITVQGAGTNLTILKPSASGIYIFRIYTNNVRVTAMTLNGDGKNTTNEGLIQIGNTGGTVACNNVYVIRDFRVDHIWFEGVGTNDLVGGLTGYPVVMASGFCYGVLDHNTTHNCYGESWDLGADGTGNSTNNPVSLQRSLDFGGYTNGTIFIEDNIWNYTLAITGGNYGAENAFDGNSGSRWVIRRNVFNIASNTRVQALISNHELCAPRSCDGASQGDVGSLMMEIYSNIVSNNGTGSFGLGQLVHQRGGRALIYSNTIYGNDTSDGPLVRLSNFRSYHRLACGAVHARGLAEVAHEADAGYLSEGLDAAKTTLNGGIDASVTTITLTSSSGFSANGEANGFAIRIGTEMIDYTGVSGNQLTGCTRGANGTTAATHSTGANVDYLKFGVAADQINNTYTWGNKTVGDADKNLAEIGGDFDAPDYSFYDIQSFVQRPNNWQYRTNSAFSYTAYAYPHPLVSGMEGGGSVGTRATISGNVTIGGRVTIGGQ